MMSASFGTKNALIRASAGEKIVGHYRRIISFPLQSSQVMALYPLLYEERKQRYFFSTFGHSVNF